MAHRSNYQLSGGHEMSIAGNYSFFGAPFIWTTLHGKKNVHLLSVLYKDDHFTKTGSGQTQEKLQKSTFFLDFGGNDGLKGDMNKLAGAKKQTLLSLSLSLSLSLCYFPGLCPEPVLSNRRVRMVFPRMKTHPR
jgi:hypothetical protein